MKEFYRMAPPPWIWTTNDDGVLPHRAMVAHRKHLTALLEATAEEGQ